LILCAAHRVNHAWERLFCMTAARQLIPHAVPRVFVSYAHDSAEHKRQVLRFCALLSQLGIDVRVDEWASGRRRDWFVWMLDQFRCADHVIVIASPRYRLVTVTRRRTFIAVCRRNRRPCGICCIATGLPGLARFCR
jgi:hypothetical protein